MANTLLAMLRHQTPDQFAANLRQLQASAAAEPPVKLHKAR